MGMMLQNYVLETFRKPNTVHHPILENILCSTVSVFFIDLGFLLCCMSSNAFQKKTTCNQ